VFKRLSRRIGIVIVPPLIYLIMRLLWVSYRKKFYFIDKPIRGQCIAVTWHGELLVAPIVYRKLRKSEPTYAIISRHFHGELIAKVLSYLKIYPLRGSSSRGAKRVLLNSIKSLKLGRTILVTPDGPRGPRHSMNGGAVALALRENLPIMIVNYQPSSYWQLKSWDKFFIPKPFAQIKIYHQIVRFEQDITKEEAIEKLRKVMIKYSI